MAIPSIDNFVFGETLSSADLNAMLTDSGTLYNGGVNTNAIAAAALSTSAIFLGSTEHTSTFTTTSGSTVQVTGVSVSVTVPSGSRKVMVMAGGGQKLNVSGGTAAISRNIYDGTIGGGGTAIARDEFQTNGYAYNNMLISKPLTVAAGSKTYNLGVDVSGGFTLTWTASATYPIWIAAILL